MSWCTGSDTRCVLSSVAQITTIQDQCQMYLQQYEKNVNPGANTRFGRLLLSLSTLRSVPPHVATRVFFPPSVTENDSIEPRLRPPMQVISSLLLQVGLDSQQEVTDSLQFESDNLENDFVRMNATGCESQSDESISLGFHESQEDDEPDLKVNIEDI